MKRILLILAVLATWQHWDRIEPLLFGNSERVAGQGEVILYATSWCGYCAKTREFLGERGIAYTELDIEKSSEARRAYDALGGRGVPVLNVNGTVIHGYNPQGILAAY
ncbi:NrdH-redoxin [Pseudomonas daroniae]|uniref:NrdH-redoxin n=1 Tax=Phytopseudomonas daroniae TaxID=2487519 RepID=A0A4Q9QME3_9GAMM|nr:MULTISPECIES: glutaredoxin family protein [Pseudomonas]TBU72650.1 NrdH-redoxin [Pseudomonas daroniae]TBU80781.1 NrdH-redoxin [Pseudomonas daroniae]TBU81816.1 NrdH-redoxin [Pseudomonas sp. FRB 228]TBU90805.1 NrdH-redoxin [Pseudomonas daroniae]